ncbi:hypothetical protein, partial [Nocardia wallacei]|uniref:hypothetical protein n=1 Tax=Nocardia wallacei TaxID=480035 RepID=UPI0024571EE5
MPRRAPKQTPASPTGGGGGGGGGAGGGGARPRPRRGGGGGAVSAAPRAPTLPALFPTAVRYGAMGISFNIAVSAFGGTTPLV